MIQSEIAPCLAGRQVSPLERALVSNSSEIPNHRSKNIWKFFAAVTVVSMVFLLSPAESSSESTLTSESLMNLLNEGRRENGLDALRENTLLQKAAQAKARHILANSYFAHTSPAGVEPWDFIKDTGLAYSFAGENLAINYTNSFELHNDFLASPSHRKNIMSEMFSEIGIAVVSGTYRGKHAVITVQMFATP